MASPAATLRLPRALPAFALILAFLACERAPGRDASTSGSTTPSATDATRPPPWDDVIGVLVATPAPVGGGILVFTRDTVVRAVQVDLFSHEATAARAALRVGAVSTRCRWERAATLTRQAASPAVSTWSLALMPNHATPLPVEGVSDLSPRDSATLVASLSRLASALPEDSTSAPYHGLPIVIREAWRITSAGAPVVVAIATRMLNMESNPRAELVTMVAESPAGADPSDLQVSWFLRTSGAEERVEATDLLAAFELRDGTVALALLREDTRGAAIEIVARASAGTWRTRWSSDALGCRD